ncbi:MAG: hypothetical protein LBD16_00640 [Oscillospiraceae bacterium]|nr:hypothetical protein [Oscillospiraceae bacterium]
MTYIAQGTSPGPVNVYNPVALGDKTVAGGMTIISESGVDKYVIPKDGCYSLNFISTYVYQDGGPSLNWMIDHQSSSEKIEHQLNGKERQVFYDKKLLQANDKVWLSTYKNGGSPSNFSADNMHTSLIFVGDTCS